MIRHYFGSKAELFRATMGWPFEPAEMGARITAGDPSEIGERLNVTRNTAKTQAIAIYRKFGVSSRRAAISRMHELVLLPQQPAGAPQRQQGRHQGEVAKGPEQKAQRMQGRQRACDEKGLPR